MLSSTMEGPWNLLAPLEVKPLKEIMKQQKGETKMTPMLQETPIFDEEEKELYKQLHQETHAFSVAMATIVDDTFHPPLEHVEDQSNMLLLLQESCSLFQENEVQQHEEEKEDHEQQYQETEGSSLDMDDYDDFYHPLEHVEDQSDVVLQESCFDDFGEEGRVQKQKEQEKEMEKFILPTRLLSFLESDNSFLTPWRWIPDQ